MAKRTHLTKEQHEYLRDIQFGKSAKEVAEMMNNKFGLALTDTNIRNYRKNHNLKSGRTGRFEKGQVPHNKGKKYPNMPPNSGQFKKGNKPISWVPVGTMTYTKDGYPKIKVAEPNVWEYLHRQEWEKYHGPIPEGYFVVFLDGDKTNWHIDNLGLLNKKEIVRMNQNHYFSEDTELTKVGIGVVKVRNKIQEVKNGL